MKSYLKNSAKPTPWKQILKELRLEAKLSQRELAEICNMPQRTLAEYENLNSARELSIYKVERILTCLGYEIDFFMVNDGEET